MNRVQIFRAGCLNSNPVYVALFGNIKIIEQVFKTWFKLSELSVINYLLLVH